MIPSQLFFTSMIFMSFTSVMMAVMSSNWMFIWMSLEINMLSFIPVILSNKSNVQLEGAVKYFLTQALSSSMLITSSLMLWYPMNVNIPFSYILMISILIKLGAAPFHWWFPEVMSSCSWLSCFLLSTTQKIAPLSLVSLIITPSSTLILFSIWTALVGGVSGLNQAKLRPLMAYSSMVHLGWIMLLMFNNSKLAATTYFLLYCILVTPLFSWFFVSNFYMMTNARKKYNITLVGKWLAPLMFMSLAGMPPLTGFIPKWMAMYYLWDMAPALMLLIVCSIMSSYFYINLLFTIIMSKSMSYRAVPSSGMLKGWSPLFMFVLIALFFAPLFTLWYCAGSTDNFDDVKHG